jgi:hypothetical protein
VGRATRAPKLGSQRHRGGSFRHPFPRVPQGELTVAIGVTFSTNRIPLANERLVILG